jgi:Tfp pilus assembly protein FimT
MKKNNKSLLPNPYCLLPYKKNGFSIIEVVVVMSFITTMAVLVIASLTRTQQSASINSYIDQIAGDIKSQQLKSMNLDTSGAATTNSYGVRFETYRYILFKGSTYSSSDPSNFAIALQQPMQFSNITLPSSQLVFTKGTGDFGAYATGQNTFKLINTVTNDQKTFTINRLGVITTVN